MPRGNNSGKENPDWKSHFWAGTTFICAKPLFCMCFPLTSDIIYRFMTLLKTRKLPLRLQIVVALSDPWQSIVPICATLKQPGTGTAESLLTPGVFWGCHPLLCSWSMEERLLIADIDPLVVIAVKTLFRLIMLMTEGWGTAWRVSTASPEMLYLFNWLIT